MDQGERKNLINKRFWSMLGTFFKIGCIGFGGGSALIPIIQKEVVEEQDYVSEEELEASIVAASITPGALPVEIAAGVGKSVGGIWGMFAGASAMALPGAIFVCLGLLLTDFAGPLFTRQINYASVGIATYIIMILAQYILKTLRSARNNRGGMIQAAIVMLCVWMFSGEQKVFKLMGNHERPVFGASTLEIFIVAFFVIFVTGGNFKSVWFLISAILSVIYLLIQGESRIIDSPQAVWIVVGAMLIVVGLRLLTNHREQGRFEKGRLKDIFFELALWILFLVALSLPALIVYPDSIWFIGRGLLSALMSFGGGDAYLSVAQGLFVDTGMVSTNAFYGNIITWANILPGSILCKVLSGIGYLWGKEHTQSILGGIVVALAGFGSAVAASCGVFGVIKIIYDRLKDINTFKAISEMIRPIVSGLLISVAISLYTTNCIIEDNAGWGWGSVAFLMLVIVGVIWIMQRTKVHMVVQVLVSLFISMLACNLFNLGMI